MAQNPCQSHHYPDLPRSSRSLSSGFEHAAGVIRRYTCSTVLVGTIHAPGPVIMPMSVLVPHENYACCAHDGSPRDYQGGVTHGTGGLVPACDEAENRGRYGS